MESQNEFQRWELELGKQLASFYLSKSGRVHIYSFCFLLKAENMLDPRDIKAYK